MWKVADRRRWNPQPLPSLRKRHTNHCITELPPPPPPVSSHDWQTATELYGHSDILFARVPNLPHLRDDRLLLPYFSPLVHNDIHDDYLCHPLFLLHYSVTPVSGHARSCQDVPRPAGAVCLLSYRLSDARYLLDDRTKPAGHRWRWSFCGCRRRLFDNDNRYGEVASQRNSDLRCHKQSRLCRFQSKPASTR